MDLIFALVLVAFLTLLWIGITLGMLLVIYGAITTRVPFVPIPHFVVDALKKEWQLKDGDVFYDLGSGDGRVTLAMADSFPQVRAIGFEKAPFPYLLSQCRNLVSKGGNARFLFKNFSRMPLTDATHIYLYLYPETIEGLLPKFEKELRKGTRVVSCDFPFKTRTPQRQLSVGTRGKIHTLYFYSF